MTVLAQYLTLKYGAKSRGHLPTHRRPITGIARAELELVSFAGTAVRGLSAGCCQTNENSHQIAGAACIYALNTWRHSEKAAVRFSLQLRP